jgi:hypothetical protein
VLDLYTALQQVDGPGLGVGEDLIEELDQLGRQLGRLATYAYPQQQLEVVGQLHMLVRLMECRGEGGREGGREGNRERAVWSEHDACR